MELKDFINNTLTQMAEGVQMAIDNATGRGYTVNPVYDNKSSSLYVIRFDLSVESEVNGGANIKVLSGGIAEKSMNRISFEVNMTLPASEKNVPPSVPKD